MPWIRGGSEAVHHGAVAPASMTSSLMLPTLTPPLAKSPKDVNGHSTGSPSSPVRTANPSGAPAIGM
jgi:hypothetical protein